MKHLHILGAGLSGLSTAFHFQGESTVYEKNTHIGGSASSMTWNGFTFDYGPHVSFTKDAYIKDLFAKTVNGDFATKQVSNSNYCQGQWIRHPAISNLCDFPKETNRNILISFLESRDKTESNIKTYRDWCEVAQGKFFAENYTHVYTRKFWTVEPEELTYQWAGERVARPPLSRVIDGALSLQTDSGYYYTEFRYPRCGGYGSYSSFWETKKDKIDIKLDHRITSIDLDKKILSFENKPDVYFENSLISSLPLPEFVNLVKDTPQDIKNAVALLRCTSIALINIALSGPPLLPYHWGYVYDEDVIFPRFTIYSNLSEFNAPTNCTSLQVEIPYSDHRPLPSGDILDRVVTDLSKCQIIHRQSILHSWQVNLKYGYVIYDFNREKALNIIHDWMRSKGVEPVGRFGLWEYLWSDQAVKSGKYLAKTLTQNV